MSPRFQLPERDPLGPDIATVAAAVPPPSESAVCWGAIFAGAVADPGRWPRPVRFRPGPSKESPRKPSTPLALVAAMGSFLKEASVPG